MHFQVQEIALEVMEQVQEHHTIKSQQDTEECMLSFHQEEEQQLKNKQVWEEE